MGYQPGGITTIITWGIVIALVLFRASRPQRISVTRMWVMAGILIVVAAIAIYGSERLFPVPAWEIVLFSLIGLAVGIPVGLLRARHTRVSATDKHGVMQLGPSWATAAIYLGAFAVRIAIRTLLPMTSALGAAVGDGVLVFAIGTIAAAYYAIYQKYEALDHATPLNT